MIECWEVWPSSLVKPEITVKRETELTSCVIIHKALFFLGGGVVTKLSVVGTALCLGKYSPRTPILKWRITCVISESQHETDEMHRPSQTNLFAYLLLLPHIDLTAESKCEVTCNEQWYFKYNVY